MELNWLEDAQVLAQTLNFSRAAALRHVTQPAFSRRIQALEDWLGTALFLRSRRDVRLTPAGEAFLRRIAPLAPTLHAAREEAQQIAGLRRPSVLFLATHVLSFTCFPALMRRVDAGGGMGAFQLVSDTLRACETLMARGAAQFLLCHHHPRMQLGLEPERFRRLVVGHDVLQPCSATAADGSTPRWPLASPGVLPLLGYSPDSGLGRILAGHPPFAALGERLQAGFTSDLAATLLAMCRAGDGIAWLPRSLVEDDLRRGTLVDVAADGDSLRIPVEICLLRPTAVLHADAEHLWARFEALRQP